MLSPSRKIGKKIKYLINYLFYGKALIRFGNCKKELSKKDFLA